MPLEELFQLFFLVHRDSERSLLWLQHPTRLQNLMSVQVGNVYQLRVARHKYLDFFLSDLQSNEGDPQPQVFSTKVLSFPLNRLDIPSRFKASFIDLGNSEYFCFQASITLVSPLAIRFLMNWTFARIDSGFLPFFTFGGLRVAIKTASLLRGLFSRHSVALMTFEDGTNGSSPWEVLALPILLTLLPAMASNKTLWVVFRLDRHSQH